jgi:hypothetical protein
VEERDEMQCKEKKIRLLAKLKKKKIVMLLGDLGLCGWNGNGDGIENESEILDRQRRNGKGV